MTASGASPFTTTSVGEDRTITPHVGSDDSCQLDYDLVLFDLDGVLVDTIDVMRLAWTQVQQDHAVDVPFDDYAAHLGLPFPQIMGRLGLGSSESLQGTYEAAASAARHLVEPYPGIPTLLRSLTEHGCRLGVVTSKSRRRALPLIEMVGFEFAAIRTPEDGPGKPAPEALTDVIAEIGADSTRTVYVGDMPVDQETARRAGVPYAHAGWGYGVPEEPTPRLLPTPTTLLRLCGVPGRRGRP